MAPPKDPNNLICKGCGKELETIVLKAVHQQEVYWPEVYVQVKETGPSPPALSCLQLFCTSLMLFGTRHRALSCTLTGWP